jgi:hypothetical protein
MGAFFPPKNTHKRVEVGDKSSWRAKQRKIAYTNPRGKLLL